MKFSDRKYVGAFFAGLLWGGVLVFIFGTLYLRSHTVLEYTSKYGFDETVRKIVENVSKSKGWSVKVGGCALPKASDGSKMRILKLCQADYAKKMLSDGRDRKVSAIIPCTFAVYGKPDGKTYVSRLNVSLAGRLLGGAPGELFTGNITKEQELMLRGIVEE